MPPQVVAQALPFVNWMLLASLAGGWFAFAALAAEATDATRGYLRFSAATSALLAGLALVADLGLPAPDTRLAIRAAPAMLDDLRAAGLAAFALAGVLYAFAVAAPRRRRLLAALGLAGFGLACVSAAVGWAPASEDAVPLLVQLTMLTAAAGGALAALVLGHWYLVTPKISTKPLITLTRVLAIVIGVQLLLFVTWALFGGGPTQAAFDALVGSSALFGWLRLVVSLLFPLVLVAMAWRTAQSRSMESATGLLYIAIAAVLAGTIGAAALYVTQGILV